jgi:hypothetical protein
LKIGIITYNVPHLKTQDVIFKLLERNYKISLILTKFKKFKKRTTLQSHRPIQFQGPNPYDLSKKFANYSTRHSSGSRSVAEACEHILKKFFKKSLLDHL